MRTRRRATIAAAPPRGPRAQLAAPRARLDLAPALAPPRAADDQVPLERGRVDLQRSEQPADVAAAAGLVGDLLEPPGQPGLRRSAACCWADPAGSRSTWSRIRSIWARSCRIRSVISAPDGSSPSRTRSWATRASESRQASGSETASPRAPCAASEPAPRSGSASRSRLGLARPGRSPRWPAAARTGRTPPSTAPSTAAMSPVAFAPFGAASADLVELVELAPGARRATARADRGRPAAAWVSIGDPEPAGRGRCAAPDPARRSGHGHGVPAVDGLRRLRVPGRASPRSQRL